MGATIIPDDDRIQVEVIVRNPKTKAVHKKKLVADSGSKNTIIDIENAKELGGDPGPIAGKPSIGDRFEIEGLEMEVEVEDRNGKLIKPTPTCKKMSGVVMDEKYKKALERIGCVGILGMDQFDSLGADPRKDVKAKRAFMQQRKSEKKAEKPADQPGGNSGEKPK
jgi:hypothetical protein